MTDKESQVWILVPARGGSKGVPRKNIRPLAGRPLILHVLSELAPYCAKERLVVSTDDDEISRVAEQYATIHRRSSPLANDTATLDEVAFEVAQWLGKKGAKPSDILLTIQPTSPFVKRKTIEKGVDMLRAGASSVITVVDDRHLRWTTDSQGKPTPLFEKRINRQWLPPTFSETGGIIGTFFKDLLSNRTRNNKPVALIELDAKEALDIDTWVDWIIAEFYANRRRIAIRVDASRELGLGHVYRALALAAELARHDVKIFTKANGAQRLGAQILNTMSYPVVAVDSDEDFHSQLSEFRPDLVILDVLDTEPGFVESVKECGAFVVSIEDLGAGARIADLVINDLYTDASPFGNHLYGVRYAILGPHFENITPRKELREEVKHVLVTFGGTDPMDLTRKAMKALSICDYAGTVEVVLGPGYAHGLPKLEDYHLKGSVRDSVKDMANVMRDADIALTSAGRTVTELMTVGVPTLVMCQNSRELRHTHASSPFGVINLGMGERIDESTLARHVDLLINDRSLRVDMRRRALAAVADRSNALIVEEMLQRVADRQKVQNGEFNGDN